MKKKILYLLLIIFINKMSAQIDAGNLFRLPTATDFAEINGIVGPQIGALVYNLDDDELYRFTSTGWQIFNSENIYNANGTLSAARTVDMDANQLNYNINPADATSGKTAITLRRLDNTEEIGIGFRNSGLSYDAAIVMGAPNNGSLDFYSGGNEADPDLLQRTMSLKDNNQIQFTQYGTDTFLNNAPFRFLGVETDGDIVEVNPNTLGTDSQTLSTNTSPGNISISGGNSINLNVNDADASITNETITAANLTGTNLNITEAGTTTTVNLAALQDGTGTDSQTLSTNASPGNISISGGNSINLNVNDADASIINETITAANLTGTNLNITEAGTTTTVNLAALQDGTGTDSQILSTNASPGNISISGGNSINVNVNDADASITNETITAANLTGTNLNITEAGATTTVNLASLNENIYNANGTLSAARTVNMDANQLNYDIDPADATSGKTAITLRRLDNAEEIGIGFRNGGLAYDATIVMASDANTSLDFNTGGNQADPDLLQRTMSLKDNSQIQFPAYIPSSVFNDTEGAQRLLATDINGNIIQSNTAKSARIFYPPSIEIDASTASANTSAPGDESVNLYNQYIAQFTLANPGTSASSAGSPGTIPTYLANELYYYVTYYDPAVFANVTISANGVMNYDIIATPTDYNTLINVVFVVK